MVNWKPIEWMTVRSPVWAQVALVVLCVTAPAGALLAAEPADPAETFAFEGYLSGQYVQRTAKSTDETFSDTQKDQDWFSQLRMDLTMPREKRYEFHFFGAARGDLGGTQPESGYDPLRDVGDAGKAKTVGYLYEAHFDINYLYAALTQLRLGRIVGSRDEPIFYDGFAADLALGRQLSMTAYGGYSVHFFDTTNNGYGKDTLGGVGFDYTPFSATKLSADYLAVNDVWEASPDRKDRLVSLKLWQQLAAYWSGLAQSRTINGEARDAKVRTLVAFPGIGVDLSATYFRQFRTQNELSTELSSYYDLLGESHPFQSIDVKLRWQFADDYAVDVGYFERELLEKIDEGPFNRSFRRNYALFEIDNLILSRLSLTLTGERWHTGASTVDTGGAELGYRYHSGKRTGRIALGSSYSAYKYDYYEQLGERTDVRTTYLNAKVPVGDQFSFTGAVEQETGIETFQTLKAGARYDF